MSMKKKILAIVMSLAVVGQTLVTIPSIASAEAYVNNDKIYVNGTDFSDFSTGGISGLPIQGGNKFYYKGSAGEHSETYMKDDTGKSYGHFKSDSKKAGVYGEGSWYFFNRNETTGMKEYGFVKFDLRLISGIFELNLGMFSDPTKGTSPNGGRVQFDAEKGKISAQTSGGTYLDVSTTIKKDTWYTVQIDLDCKLQEYTVTVKDAKGAEVGKQELMAFVDTACTEIRNTCFSYVRKQGGHEFDMTNLTIAKIKASELTAVDPNAPKPTVAPTAEPTVAPTTEPVATTSETVLKIGSSKAITAAGTIAIDAANANVTPVINNDRTLVPLRFLSETFGAEVNWDGATQTVTLKKGDTTIVMVIGQNSYTVNGAAKELDVPAQIMNDRTMVPIRAILESFGKKLFYKDGIIVIGDTDPAPTDAQVEAWKASL